MTTAHPSKAPMREACRLARIEPDGAELITTRANAVWRLPDAVVARVTMRREEFESAARSLQVSRWLAEQGLPVAPPWRNGPTEPIIVGDHAVTFWDELSTERQSPRGIGAALRELHQVAELPSELELPPADPVALARWATMDPGGVLDEAQRNFINERLVTLSAEYSRLDFALPPGLVHRDAHGGNALGRDGTTVLGDWDFCAMGAREWDLIATAIEQDRMRRPASEYDEFVDAYGFNVREWPGFAVLRELHELWLIGGELRKAENSRVAAAEAKYRIATLQRGDTTEPWHYGTNKRGGRQPSPGTANTIKHLRPSSAMVLSHTAPTKIRHNGQRQPFQTGSATPASERKKTSSTGSRGSPLTRPTPASTTPRRGRNQ